MKKYLALLLLLLALPLAACQRYDALPPHTEGTLTYEGKAKDGILVELTVREDGSTRFSAVIDSAFPVASMTEAISFADMSFDGHLDLLVRTSPADAPARYDVFLWNDSRRTYTKNTLLSSLEEPTADEGVIRGVTTSLIYESRMNDAGETYEVYTYERMQVSACFDGASLIPFHKEGVIYYSESDIYCYTLYEQTEQGGLEAAREIWQKPDKFKAGKYADLMPTLPHG